MKNKRCPAYNISLDTALKQGGFYGGDGVWNSLVKIDGRVLRGRVETLVIKRKQQQLFMQIKNFNKKKYRIPGGSFERDVPNYIQAANEVNEEARIKVKNVVNTGVHYTTIYTNTPTYMDDLSIKWVGCYTEVYVAEYDGKFTGEVDKKDEDSDMYTYGRFYNIRDIYSILSEPHKQIIDSIFETIEKSHISENMIVLRESTDEVHYYPYYTPFEMNKLGVFNESKNKYSDIQDEAIEWYHEYTDTLHNEDSNNWLKELQERYYIYQKEPSLENKQLVLNLGWNPEVPVTLENVLKASTATERRLKKEKEKKIDKIDESIIFTKQDKVFNLDKFENGESNILFITGLPGSGKSTLSQQIASDYNAEVIQLDYFQSYHNLAMSKYTSRYDPTWELINRYMNRHPRVKADSINFSHISLVSFKEYFVPFFRWMVKELEKDKDTIYIVEGVHPILFISYKEIKNKPIYCVNTSAIKSLVRHWIRDDWTINDIVQHGYGDLLQYMEWEKSYNDMKDGLNEANISGNSIKEAQVYDPISGEYIESVIRVSDFIETGKMIQSKLNSLHMEDKLLFIKNRDVESDDNGFTFAEYNISNKDDSKSMISFIDTMNGVISASVYPGQIEVPENIKQRGILKIVDPDNLLGESTL